MIDDRIADRRAQVRDEGRRKRLRRTVTVVLVVCAVIVVAAVERSALVGLEEIEVAGTERLAADAVLEAAGLELGTSTVRLGLGSVEERVTDLPLVREASARRVDPLTVRITVTERQPVLVVVGDGEPRLIDRDGVVIVDGDLDELARVMIGDAPPAVGASVTDDAALANAHRAWRGLSGPLRSQVERYEARSADDLSLQLDSGIEVRFGRADRIDEKVRALGVVLADVGTTPIEVIDVRAPSAPVVVGGP